MLESENGIVNIPSNWRGQDILWEASEGMNRAIRQGNILGYARAEADAKMLSKVFIETSDFSMLYGTRDFSFVVGRRGTGKSALYIQLMQRLKKNKQLILIGDSQREYDALALNALLKVYGDDYKILRATTRQIWRVAVLMSILKEVINQYKVNKSQAYPFLKRYYVQHKEMMDYTGFSRVAEILKTGQSITQKKRDLPRAIVESFDVSRLESNLVAVLNDVKKVVMVIYDGLDEGWAPDSWSVASLGGLAMAAADFSDHISAIHVLLFIRDNMFRALAYMDSDYSRHIEGSTLRLQWNENSLFQLITARLRIALGLESVESDLKIWNRFAHRGLRDRDGFKRCLQHTLYRPRDILVLLNKAYVIARRSGRPEIVEEDIETTAVNISQGRYLDLIKEYEEVLPGLQLFTSIFRGRSPLDKYINIVGMLDDALLTQDYSAHGSGDFAIFNTGQEIFDALYGVGFLGFRDLSGADYKFCHDGAPGSYKEVDPNQEVMIHPCYWRYLGLSDGLPDQQIVMRINDEYSAKGKEHVEDIRTRQIGMILEELPRLPLGDKGSHDFEQWVWRAVAALFSGNLSNFELHPNGNALSRRDVVATNMASDGFWKRIRDDYDSRQILFEVKNYNEIKQNDFRQVLDYTTGEYGRFAIIVSHSENEGISETEKGYVQKFYHEHNRLIMICPSMLLTRCLSKFKRTPRFDYAEDQFNKRMDTFVRRYLSLSGSPPFRRKKKRK